jgi:hypothetical protein
MRALLLAITLLASLPTQAQFTGLRLEEWCSESEADLYAACLTYFAGHADASAVWKHVAVKQGTPVSMFPCTDGIQPEVLIRVWLKYIEENPEKLDSPPEWSIVFALMESFQCEE